MGTTGFYRESAMKDRRTAPVREPRVRLSSRELQTLDFEAVERYGRVVTHG
jgi:hypothetical protein